MPFSERIPTLGFKTEYSTLIVDLEEDEYELEEADLKDLGQESQQLQGSNSPHEALNFEEGHSGETIDWSPTSDYTTVSGRFHAHNHSVHSDDPLPNIVSPIG